MTVWQVVKARDLVSAPRSDSSAQRHAALIGHLFSQQPHTSIECIPVLYGNRGQGGRLQLGVHGKKQAPSQEPFKLAKFTYVLIENGAP